MKHRTLLFATIFPLLVMGCKPKPASATSATQPPPAQPAVAAQSTAGSSLANASQPFTITTTEVSRNANPATADSTTNVPATFIAKKNDFVLVMRTQLDVANKEIDAMDSQVTDAKKEDKDTAQPKIDVLRARAQGLKEQLNNAETISEAGWDNYAEQVNKAYKELKDSMADTRLWLDNYFISRKSF